MGEIDAHFDAYEHLKHLPRQGEALLMLRKVASMVKPIMRKRGWKIGTLAEFLPDEANLLGLNIGRTERILIRLRYHYDSRQFLSMDQVTDTLIHELSHIVYGPHDVHFHNLWNELRDEHRALLSKGYSGEGFLSQGQKLGGQRIPLEEVRRQARLAAQKRKAFIGANPNSGGHRLGGTPGDRAVDMRREIANSASRRNSIIQGCASGSSDVDRLVDRQEQDGFRTRAEQSDASDLTIARALQDLYYEEEMQRLGAPTGAGGLYWSPRNGLQFDSNSTTRATSPLPSPGHAWNKEEGLPSPTDAGPPLTRLLTGARNSFSGSSSQLTDYRDPSRLLSEDEERRRTGDYTQIPTGWRPIISTDPDKWACPQCTLHNPLDFLTCEACGLEQPPQPIPSYKQFGSQPSAPALPKPPPHSNLRGQGSTPYEPARGRMGWNCLECGTFMENQWWTCTLCGTMKMTS